MGRTSCVFSQKWIGSNSLGCDTIDHGGAGVDSTNAVLIPIVARTANDTIHFVWNTTGWRLERYYPAGGAADIVIARQASYNLLTGTFLIELDITAGLVTVTGPDGVVTVADWDAEIPASPLSNYSNSSYELRSHRPNRSGQGGPLHGLPSLEMRAKTAG